VKIVLGLFAAALLVGAGAFGGYLLADEDDEASEARAPLPSGWALCSNPARGFAIAHPARWHTSEVAEEEACQYFDPQPFEVPKQTDFSGTALELDPTGEGFETVVDSLVDRRFARVLARRETTLHRLRAVRVETEASGEGFEERGVKTTSWVLDRGGVAFIVRTTGFPGRGDYASRQAILERAVETLIFFTPTAAQLADGRVLPAQPELPEAVERKRRAIAEAAAARDFDALRGLLPRSGGFEYTYGGPVAGGPVAHWRRLEATTDETPLESLVAILSLPYTRERGLYVWPFAFDRDPNRLTPEEVELLATFATPREIRGWREIGAYLGWRAGIEPDGEWVFYIAGD
jgi:hypothetical protein